MPTETIISIILTFAFIGVGILIFVQVAKKRKAKASFNANRLPKRVPHRISTNSPSSHITTAYTASANTARRLPTPAPTVIKNNDECLRFRMCPRCHSKNEKGNEAVILKKKANAYYCSVCKANFNIQGNILN